LIATLTTQPKEVTKVKTRNILPLLVTVFFLLASVSAYAQHGMGYGRQFQEKPEHGMQGMQKGMHECLELTAEQLKQVEEFKFEMKKKLIPLQADLKLARLELHEMMSGDASADVLDKKIDEIGAIETKIQKITIRHKLQFRDILTDEQKKKCGSMPGFGHGFGKGHGACGGGKGGHGFGAGCGSNCAFRGGKAGVCCGAHFGN
jgi:Spy/CpxP family protein refolding chaperone